MTPLTTRHGRGIMSVRMRKVLEPHYMKHFKCISLECEDSCCIGWGVDIDKATYARYQKLRGGEVASLVRKYAVRHHGEVRSDARYGRFKLMSGSRCPLLSQEMLCKIQLQLGEDYLSSLCRAYPRIVNRIDVMNERSATVSCPEAARLVLMAPEGIVFHERLEPEDPRILLNAVIETDSLTIKGIAQRHFWELRIFIIDLLQNRRYSLDERLMILGLFTQKLEKSTQNEDGESVSGLIASYTAIIREGSLKESLQGIASQCSIQIMLLKEISDVINSMGITDKRYLECHTEFLEGLRFSPEQSGEELAMRYQSASEAYFKPFLEKYGYMMENYLVNHVFKNLFPFTGDATLFDTYMGMVIQQALIKMHLVGMGACHNGITVDMAVKLIHSFAKTIEHNPYYLGRIAELMRRNNLNTMLYMAVMIKG